MLRHGSVPRDVPHRQGHPVLGPLQQIPVCAPSVRVRQPTMLIFKKVLPPFGSCGNSVGFDEEQGCPTPPPQGFGLERPPIILGKGGLGLDHIRKRRKKNSTHFFGMHLRRVLVLNMEGPVSEREWGSNHLTACLISALSFHS